MRLFELEQTWAAAAFGAFFPERTALPHGIAQMDPGRFLADTIASAPLEQSLGLRLTLWMVALAPVILLRRLGTIATIEPNERQRVLESLIASRIYAVRQLVVAFKAMASLLYTQSPAIRAAMTTPQPRPSSSGLVALRTSRTAPSGETHEHAAE